MDARLPADWVHLETRIFWFLFAALFLSIATWETLTPRAHPTQSTGRRWGVNAWLLLIGSIVTVSILRISPVGIALLAEGRTWPSLYPLPLWLGLPLTLLALDAWAYTGHRLLHAFRWGWRIHQVHHSDLDYDVTTGSRFHPLEMMFLKSGQLAVVFLLGPAPIAVLIAEMIGLTANFFEHANARLPAGLTRWLRYLVITPDIHRIHHSFRREEQQKNYGQLFPIWDRLAGTFLDESAAGPDGPVGVPHIVENLSWREALLLPFRDRRPRTAAATSASGGSAESTARPR